MPTTHQSALVLIPPREVWDPIQAIRRVHDRQFRRWMPHVTLLYPFVPRAEIETAAALATEALAAVEPFQVVLARPDVFRHRGDAFTLWFAPEPMEALAAVHAALLRRFPGCDANTRFRSGFTPHLSVGQARGEEQLRAFRQVLEGWRPLTFEARRVSIIVRQAPPADVFRVFAEISLGGRASAQLPEGVRP